MICAACGQKLHENSIFCSTCGERAAADAVPDTLPEIGPENTISDDAIVIEPVFAGIAPPSDNDFSPQSEQSERASVKTAVLIEGVEAAEIEDLFRAIKPASPWHVRLRSRYVLIPLLTLALAAIITAAVSIYNTSNVGAARAFLSLSRDFNARVNSTPLAFLAPLSDCLTNGSVSAKIAYTDDTGDNFALDLSLLSSSEARSHLLSVCADVYNTEIDLALYLNSERLAVGGSFFGDDYYGLRFNTFSSDLKRFASLSGIKDIDHAALERYVSILHSAASESGTDAGQDASRSDAIMREFIAAIDTVHSREKITRNGKTVTAHLYTYTLDTSDIIVLIQNYVDLLRSDEHMFAGLVRYFESDAHFDGSGYYDPIFGGYYTASTPQAAAAAFLEDIVATLDYINSVCDGTVTVKLYCVKRRVAVVELGVDLSLDGSPLNAFFTLDFGSSVKDDWAMIGSFWDSWYEYRLAASWRFEKSGKTHENTLNLTYGDSFYTDRLSVSSEWNAANGAFVLSLHTSDTAADKQLCGNLTLGGGGFKLRLDTAAALNIDFYGSADAQIDSPEYINLDKWNADILTELETAVTDVYKSIYMYG